MWNLTQCLPHNTLKGYLFNYGSYYLEILHEDSDTWVKDGEIGRIVVTDLFNKAFPMIRYDTGDMGRLKIHKNGFHSISEIQGRVIDLIKSTANNAISPVIIINTMWGVEHIKQWQFIQKDIKHYELKIIPFGIVDEYDLNNKFKNILGDDAQIYFNYVNTLPIAASGKRKTIVCEL